LERESVLLASAEENKNQKILWWLLALGAIVGVAFSSASQGAKREVRERASGRCESCGIRLNEDESIVGHMDHTRISDQNGHKLNRYNALSNLRLHCPKCEAEWHLQHIGNARDIGLSEKNNNVSALGALISLHIWSGEKFWELYSGYRDKVEALFSKYEKDLPR